MKYNIYDEELNTRGFLPVQIQPEYMRPMNPNEFAKAYKPLKTKAEKMQAMYDLISSHGLLANIDPEIRAKLMKDCGVI